MAIMQRIHFYSFSDYYRIRNRKRKIICRTGSINFIFRKLRNFIFQLHNQCPIYQTTSDLLIQVLYSLRRDNMNNCTYNRFFNFNVATFFHFSLVSLKKRRFIIFFYIDDFLFRFNTGFFYLFFILKNTGSLFVGITESCKFLFRDV